VKVASERLGSFQAAILELSGENLPPETQMTIGWVQPQHHQSTTIFFLNLIFK
jgi:hypothetical protein